jgi:NitT/TauT family transport system substrate-binding protein
VPRVKTIRALCVLVMSGLLLSPALGRALDAPLKKAVFLPQWVPQAQFAGYYTAYKKGIYKKHGIDLAILTGGASMPPSEYLETGRAQFVTSWLSSALQMRSKGVRLVNIGQVVQRSSLMLIAKKSKGITKPADMEGKKVGLWAGDFEIQPKVLFRKAGLHVDEVRQSFSVNLFLRGGVDVASAMWYNEYHTIINGGIDPDELSTFFFSEMGLNFPEDGIYVLEDTFRRDPEMARAFVEASLEGWNYAFAHPEEAVDIVLQYAAEAKIPANRAHQKWMLARMKELILPPGEGVPFMGFLKETDYTLVARELKAEGLIKNAPDFKEFYKGPTADAEK